MKIFDRIRSAPYAVLAALTLATMTSEAQASNAGAVANTITQQIANFLGGVFFLVAGLLKLKQAADNQGQQVRYGEGIWRIAVGTGLIAIPALATVMTGTFGVQATAVTPASAF